MAERPRLGLRGSLLVVRMMSWRIVLPALKRRMSLDRLVRLSASPRERVRDHEREELVVRVGARLWRSSPGPCLDRSLAIHRQLGLGGAAPELAIGLAKDAESVIAHAWVAVDGVALLDLPRDLDGFGVVVRFDSDGLRMSS